MHGAVLHVYNFRNLPDSKIVIGEDSLIGEYSVIRGQGGVEIGNRVFTSPFSQIIAVNHIFDDPEVSFVEQGITAEGIIIEDDVWIRRAPSLLMGSELGKGLGGGRCSQNKRCAATSCCRCASERDQRN